MPVISTHHSSLVNSAAVSKYDKVCTDISMIVSNITYNILRDCPGLVADVANGDVEKAVLETAVIKDMDRHKYHFGLPRQEVIEKVFDYMFGYGVLQPYIDDEEITDIDGTKYNEFVIRRRGKKQTVTVSFGNEAIFDTYCKLIAVRNGGILNENDSHCRVTDERNRLRINISIRPRNISGPSISIRKHRHRSYSLKELVGMEMLSGEMADFLTRLACCDASVLFCGKGAAGKTTLMRAFVNALPKMERVLIVESDAELYPDKPYCIEQRIKKRNEGGRTVTLKDLVRDGLTMSLDTYCVGEIVGEEAWDFIRAAYTGHKGIATTHAESAEDAFARLLTLSKSAEMSESEKTMNEMMGRSMDVIIFLENFKVIDILEVQGYDTTRNRFVYNRLFSFEIQDEDVDGRLYGQFINIGDVGERLKRKLLRRGLPCKTS